MAKQKKKPTLPAGMTPMILVDIDGKKLGVARGTFACETANAPLFVRLPRNTTTDAGIDMTWRVFTRQPDTNNNTFTYVEEP